MSKSPFALLTINAIIVAVYFDQYKFYLFDSHTRDLNGRPDPDGHAVLLHFESSVSLNDYLNRNYNGMIFNTAMISFEKSELQHNEHDKHMNFDESECELEMNCARVGNELNIENSAEMQKDILLPMQLELNTHEAAHNHTYSCTGSTMSENLANNHTCSNNVLPHSEMQTNITSPMEFEINADLDDPAQQVLNNNH